MDIILGIMRISFWYVKRFVLALSKAALAATAAAVIFFLAHFIIVNRGLDTEVWWSVSRDECVKVDPPDRGTCDDLPERHKKVPVQ